MRFLTIKQFIIQSVRTIICLQLINKMKIIKQKGMTYNTKIFFSFDVQHNTDVLVYWSIVTKSICQRCTVLHILFWQLCVHHYHFVII